MAGIQPYAFEPVQRNRSPVGQSDSESSSDSDVEIESDIESRVLNTEWCSCGSCRAMVSEKESLCCQEMSRLDNKLEEDDVHCITDHESFDVVCTHPEVLRTALVCMHDVRSDSLSEPLTNRTLRLAAYRQFTWWVHTKLGKAVRLVIPSCAVWAIRDAYPDPDDNYTGFIDAESDNEDDFPL